MSYQVLARKWRPKTFADLSGQEHVVTALSNSLERGRLHHAYLLTGTRGVGKTTIARILAKCLNCEKGVSATPCGGCAACQAIDGGRFVDLLELDAASNTGIDNMREILDNARYAPTVGRFKVYLIDEVHMLSKAAFNSMLKTLEEPPEHVKFVLATTDPQKIPVTVLSRCLQFNLKQMPPAAIVKHLEHILREEKIPAEPEALALLARAAAGSMRDALSLLDQAIAHGAGKIAARGVADMLGAIDRTYLLDVLAAISKGDAAAVLKIADDMQARSLSFDAALGDLAALLLKLALAQTLADALADEPDRARLGELAGALDPESVQLYYQMALQGREDLPLAPDEHAGFLMTLLRMLAFRPEPGGGKSLAPQAAAAPQAKLPRGAAPQSAAWAELAAPLQVTGAARELARNSELARREGGLFELVVPKAKAFLADRVHQYKLKAALEQHLGTAITVKVAVGETSGTSTAALEAGDRNARRAAATQAVQSDGFVQDLVNLFDGKVVDSSIRQTEK